MRPRKKPNLAPRLEACAPVLLTPETAQRGVVRSTFARPDQPIRLEIGCGKGRFICQLAAQNPDVNFVAMEREANVAVIAAELALGIDARTHTSGETIPGNLRFLIEDARILDKVFEENELDRIYINFCDPWHKHKQFKRRLTYREWLRLYQRLLRPGGELQFKTDNYMLYHFSTFEFAEVMPPYFKTADLHSSDRAADNVMTEYEQYFSDRGQPIYAIRARKEEALP